MVLTGDDPCLLCQRVLWANGSNTETQYDHTSTGVFVCNSSNETKKTQEIFSLKYLLVSLELNHKYL